MKKVFFAMMVAFAVCLLSGCVSHKAPVRQYVLPSYQATEPQPCLTVSMPEYLEGRNFVQVNYATGEIIVRNGAMWNVPFKRMVMSVLADKLQGTCKGVKVELTRFAIDPAGTLLVKGVIKCANDAQAFAFEVAPEKADCAAGALVAQYEKALNQLAEELKRAQ
jgi:uncharacterized lipoprotein YmbA